MKERFYNAINELHALRNESVDALYYDAEHEKRRKEQLIKQWNRTEQQVVFSNGYFKGSIQNVDVLN